MPGYMMTLKPFGRIILLAWIFTVLYVFAAYTGQVHPTGRSGELIRALFSYLSAGYLK